jgi:hypothetical protein
MATKYPRICDEIIKHDIEYYESIKMQPNNKTKKMIDSVIKNMKSDQYKKKNLARCKKLYLNPKCDTTIFETGDDETITKKIIREFNKSMRKEYKYKPGTKNYDSMKQLYLDIRKDLFKKDSSVLKDGFYKGLSSKDVAQLKEKGAISGCTRTSDFKILKIQKTRKNNKTNTNKTNTNKTSCSK